MLERAVSGLAAEEAVRGYDAAALRFRSPRAKNNFLYHGSRAIRSSPSSSTSGSFPSPPCPLALDLELGHASSRLFPQRSLVVGGDQETLTGMRSCGQGPASASRIPVVGNLNLPPPPEVA